MNQGGSYIKDPLTGKISLVERTEDSAPVAQKKAPVIETAAVSEDAEPSSQTDNSGKTRKPKE